MAALMLALPACGPSSAPESEPSTASPSPSPTPMPSVPPPPTNPAPTPDSAVAPAPREVYVVTAFQAVSDLGTHDFPVGTKVNVLKEEGSEYLVEYEGVGVQIAKTYFSDSAPAAVNESGEPDAPTPDATRSDASEETLAEEVVVEESTVEETTIAEETSGQTVDVDTIPLDPEQQKVEQITESLREVNEEIRQTRTAIQSNPGSAPSKEAQLDNLRRKRDRLGEELTTYGKP
jgi:hypothetical protein